MGFNFFMGYLSTNAKVVSRRWKHELKEVLYFLQETRFCILLKNVVLGMISEWIMFGLDFDFLDEGRCQEIAMKTQENLVQYCVFFCFMAFYTAFSFVVPSSILTEKERHLFLLQKVKTLPFQVMKIKNKYILLIFKLLIWLSLDT